MAAPNSVFRVDQDYYMLPASGNGPIQPIQRHSYIIPVKWGHNSDEFEEKLLLLIDEYLATRDCIRVI